MSQIRTLSEWMLNKELPLAQLVEAAALDKRVVEAIAQGRYTPSPEQRRRIATALGVEPDRIAWGHSAQVEHIQGHGAQFGRSP
ncbi:MAG: XRE family transcriptional regulator [Gemmataceae bacterium]|nr:XRE family transcriptional regulator [Gemmataceae bacterium]